MTLEVLGVLGATLTIFAYLGFIWWLDRYEREPLWLVGAVFLWGAFGGTCLGCGLSTLPSGAAQVALGPEVATVLTSVVFAPVFEELAKGLVFLVLLATLQFDNQTDGLIYGAAAGLGFACVENLLYFSSAADDQTLWMMIFMRTLFTALVHCISSAALGMAIGWARYRTRSRAAALGVAAGGYAVAVGNHALWNAAATFSPLLGAESAVGGAALMVSGIILVGGASVTMFALTQWSLHREHRIIHARLTHEAQLGNIPADHAAIIPYWTKRMRSGWLADSVDKEAYVRAATLLAFRQHQLTVASGRRRERFEREVETYRRKVAELLAAR